MKKIYQNPTLEIVQLDIRNSIMISVSKTEVDTGNDGFEQRSQEKYGWDAANWNEEE